LIEKLNDTLDLWIDSVDRYTYAELTSKPTPQHWSIGQVCMHLIADSLFYIEQMGICVTSNDHADDEASVNGKTMLHNNSFPDEIIEGAPENALIPQPESKERLVNDLFDLKGTFNRVAANLARSPYRGKSKHPGLGYFSAMEWLQFADMHFRHHLRQKQRIDDFLANQRRR
jgi:hypothetical protein